MKVEIDINSDTADFLIVENLKQTIVDMEQALKAREEQTWDYEVGFFSTNKEKDLVEIAKHIEAFKITLSYFGVSNE